MFVEDRGMLFFNLERADPTNVPSSTKWDWAATIGIVVRGVPIQSWCIEVMDDIAANTRIVVVAYGWDERGRALCDKRFVVKRIKRLTRSPPHKQ